MKKYYISIGTKDRRHTIICANNIESLSKFLIDPDMLLHQKWLVLETRLGKKPNLDPYMFEIEDAEFDKIVSDIKKKISSPWKKDMSFDSINLTEDSRHLPMIKVFRKIKTKTEEVHANL